MSNADTARDLVVHMVAAGEWPEPGLLEEVLAKGETAVEPLREVVRRDVHGWPEEAPLCFAIDMLGTLGAMAAIPDLIQLFYHYDNETLQSASGTLGLLGQPAVEPALTVLRDTSLEWYPRTEASTAAILAAGDDAGLRERVAATLRELLAGYLERADEFEDDDDYDMASSLVADLTHLADPQARELIAAAFKADLVDTLMLGPEDVHYFYRRGPEKTERPGPRDWLEEYREQYQEELQARAAGPRTGPGAADFGPLLEMPEPPQPHRHTGPRIGRNDPCWCGSGKKFKKCHGA